jgi:hypothetical protein
MATIFPPPLAGEGDRVAVEGGAVWHPASSSSPPSVMRGKEAAHATSPANAAGGKKEIF